MMVYNEEFDVKFDVDILIRDFVLWFGLILPFTNYESTLALIYRLGNFPESLHIEPS